jgi:hypothetical protein
MLNRESKAGVINRSNQKVTVYQIDNMKPKFYSEIYPGTRQWLFVEKRVFYIEKDGQIVTIFDSGPELEDIPRIVIPDESEWKKE